MNKDKSIKDLKKRNDSLKMQYEYRNIRCITLEKRIERYEQQIQELTNNWNELEEWVKEYINKNDNWYNNELSTYDKQYYGDGYYTTNYILKKFLDKMKEIKEGNNVSSRD